MRGKEKEWKTVGNGSFEKEEERPGREIQPMRSGVIIRSAVYRYVLPCPELRKLRGW